MTDDENKGSALPELLTSLPGPRSVTEVDVLARHESPGVTARRSRAGESRGIGSDPIVWNRAVGANVWDVDGNRFVDLTGAFGVAMIGHSHPDVISAIETQSGQLIHGMGDVFPNDKRIKLMRTIAEMAPDGLTQSILTSSGSEAVEAAHRHGWPRGGRV